MADLLSGIRVVDFTQYLAGPTVTRLMAELGADVVKVELAPGGDPARLMPIQVEGRSGFYVQQNRGKRSLCVDWDDPRGLDVMRRLLARADVVVENFGPGVMEKRGITYDAVRADNPAVIMASISAFGRTGSYANRVGYDMIAQAFSGMMHMAGERNGPPTWVGMGVGDVNAGVHALAAVAIALFHRLRTGEGQSIDISMVDALFHMHELNVHAVGLTGGRMQPTRTGRHSGVDAPIGVFKGPQGWIVMLALARQWPRVPEAIGRPDLLDDPRFANSRERARHREELAAIIEEWLGGFATDEEALAVLEAHRIPCAPVLSPAQTVEHPYFRERGAIRTVPDPVLGEITIPGFPFRFSASPDRPELVAPLLGEHNAAILDELGYDDATAAGLHADGVLRAADR
jgi:CoA:oxalate CoA-transferase